MIDKEKELQKLDSWIDALKSGEYVQGKYRLKQTNVSRDTGEAVVSHCCLGVLCELSPFIEEKSTYRSARFGEVSTFISIGSGSTSAEESFLPYVQESNRGTLEFFIYDRWVTKLYTLNDASSDYDLVIKELEKKVRKDFVNYLDGIKND